MTMMDKVDMTSWSWACGHGSIMGHIYGEGKEQDFTMFNGIIAIQIILKGKQRKGRN